MYIEKKSPIPRYYQLKKILQSQIEKGKYKLGDKIPSENELAEKYGISRPTVRQAFNELTQEEWLYKERGRGTFCGFIPTETSKEIKSIAAFIPSVLSYIFPYILRGIDDVVHQKGYNMILVHSDCKLEKEKEQLRSLMNKGIKGFIIDRVHSASKDDSYLAHFFELKRKGIPFVLMDNFIEKLECSYVKLDDVLGGYLATEYLIKLGHKRIGCIYLNTYQQGINRHRGYKEALGKYNLEYDEELVKTYEAGVPRIGNSIQLLVNELLALEERRPTAIFFYNDEITYYGYNTIRERELRVPDDISIVGFDNCKIAIPSSLRLTTVEHPKYKLGKKAAEVLFQQIENKGNMNIQQVILKPTLIIGNSCRDVRTKTSAQVA